MPSVYAQLPSPWGRPSLIATPIAVRSSRAAAGVQVAVVSSWTGPTQHLALPCPVPRTPHHAARPRLQSHRAAVTLRLWSAASAIVGDVPMGSNAVPAVGDVRQGVRVGLEGFGTYIPDLPAAMDVRQGVVYGLGDPGGPGLGTYAPDLPAAGDLRAGVMAGVGDPGGAVVGTYVPAPIYVMEVEMGKFNDFNYGDSHLWNFRKFPMDLTGGTLYLAIMAKAGDPDDSALLIKEATLGDPDPETGEIRTATLEITKTESEEKLNPGQIHLYFRFVRGEYAKALGYQAVRVKHASPREP